MDEEIQPKQPNKRLLPQQGPNKAFIMSAVTVAALVLIYTALCLYVAFGGRILPGVCLGPYGVGNLTPATANQQVTTAATDRFSQVTVVLTYGSDGTLSVPGSFAAIDGAAGAQAAYLVGRTGSPLGYGLAFLQQLFQPTTVGLPLSVSPTAPGGATLLDDAFQGHETPVIETTYTVEEQVIRTIRGTPGLVYDRKAALHQLLSAIAQQADWLVQGGPEPLPLHLEPLEIAPAPVDWAALANQVHVEAADASLNPETMEIEPSVTGVSLDPAQAASRYDNARDGAEFEIPLIFTPPAMTTEQLNATLFQDLLGEATSRVSGVAARKQNVKLAAELVNDTILLPEGIFAYNECTGPRTVANGFRPAPSYVNGLTVDEVGGGICQVSSTVYYAVLNSNLKIVERRNHSFAVGYVPDGMDATVFFGSLDFRFQNSTPSPIKIVTESFDKNGSRWLTVKIYGAKADDTYVEMEARRLSTTAYETVYKPDASVPAGTTKESVTPYTGRKVESYRCIYNGDGTLLSRTLEAVSNYQKRDRVILYNPADAHLYDPNAPKPTPAPTPSAPPVQTATPPTQTPVTSPTTVPQPTETSPVSPEFQTPAPTPEPVPIDTLPSGTAPALPWS